MAAFYLKVFYKNINNVIIKTEPISKSYGNKQVIP